MRIVKIGQKIRRQHFFVYSMLCTQSFTEQKTSLSLYFLTDFNHFNENCLTVLIFYSKSKSEKCRSNSVVFKVRNGTLASVRSIFVRFQRFACHFDANCLTNPNMCSKSKLDYQSSKCGSFNFHTKTEQGG